LTVHRPGISLILLIVGLTLLIGGCSGAKGEGFAIYLTKDNIPPSQMEALSHVDLADQPVISLKDIISYNAQTHEIKITDSAFELISSLDVPVSGKSFLVCVNKAPIYWGAFWTPISSISFGGVTIWKPYDSQQIPVIKFELGYPSSDFYGGQDPRNNAEVRKSLEKSGKLIEKLSITEVDKLPGSLKGYELYSWQKDSQWHFTLVTGTNRNKTPEEIVSEEDFISETGWVNIHVAGIDAIKNVLSKLPANEHVSWITGRGLTQTNQTGVDISFPPGPTIDTIKEYALGRDLDFSVTGSY
jgi:hypothetical protein